MTGDGVIQAGITPREQVIETLADFARATDARDWSTLHGLLDLDARGYGVTGATQIVAQMTAHLGGVGFTQHLLSNHRVTFTDEQTARAFSYGRIMHVGTGPFEGQTLEIYGEYDDKLARRHDGRWVLTRRWFDIQHSVGDRALLRPAD